MLLVKRDEAFECSEYDECEKCDNIFVTFPTFSMLEDTFTPMFSLFRQRYSDRNNIYLFARGRSLQSVMFRVWRTFAVTHL